MENIKFSSLSCLHDKDIYLKKYTSASVSEFGYFKQVSEYQKHYKCNICYASVLMHKITAAVYLKLHEVCFLFQMEHPSEER